MKLPILSDLHTEFADFVPPETDAEAVILAGDIGVGAEDVRRAARHYPVRPGPTAPTRVSATRGVIRESTAAPDLNLISPSSCNVHMFICAAGDIHGAMDRLYDDVLAFEASLGVRFDYVLHVGDFGVWPDPNRVDKATRKHDGAGDFPAWLAGNRAAPRPTVFIKGNHEDFVWLDEQLKAGRREILPELSYLPSGDVIDIGEDRERIRIGGIGGCHGPSNYERRSRDLQGWAKRHFTYDECQRLSSHGGVDVLLLHDAPAGVEFTWKRKDGSVRRRYQSEAEGLAQAVARTRPRVCFFGQHHTRLDAEIAGVRCIGLNKVAMPGHLVALDVPARGRGFELLGEWPDLKPLAS